MPPPLDELLPPLLPPSELVLPDDPPELPDDEVEALPEDEELIKRVPWLSPPLESPQATRTPTHKSPIHELLFVI